MFDEIVPRYDFLNHFLSLGFDYGWRKRAVRKFSNRIDGGTVIDICSGTGDLSFALLKHRKFRGNIIGIDGSIQMLLKAGKRIIKCAKGEIIKLIQGDAQQIPLKDSSADAAMAAFGIRNLPDPAEGFKEIHNKLKKGGEFVILEFSVPENRFYKILYGLYFKRILPALGGLISGRKSAYLYLVQSVYSFSENFDICSELQKCGFTNIKKEMLTMEIVSIYSAIKND